jgi:hypothetical protein
MGHRLECSATGQHIMPRILLFTCTGLGALFVLWLGGQLPATVASHFGIGGVADAGGVLVLLLLWAAWLWILHARFRRDDAARSHE